MPERLQLLLTLLTLLHCGCSQTLHQTPSFISLPPNSSVQLDCYLPGYSSTLYMYWYRQPPQEGALHMLFLSRSKDLIDDSSEKHFKAARPTQQNFTLSTDSLFPNHTGLYYCAWSRTLSQAGQADAEITQTPSLVLERGHTAYLRCQQSYGHNNMFWYRQDPGHTDAKITQTPSLVLKRGQTAQLTCRQTDGHDNMYWYQQQQGKGLQLIYYSLTVNNKAK
ncbi:hypothetical protein KIL84_018522, partial [Mauremys mutica]